MSNSSEDLNVATYHVSGMTCLNCVRHVSEEVSALDGVTEVEIDLESGTMKVLGASLPSEDAVGEAVAEAGYELVS